MRDEYWRIFCDEVAPDILGINPSKEQVDKLTRAALNHRDMEHESCGYQEADRSVRRMEIQDAQDKVFRFVERLMEDMDRGPCRFFDLMNDTQKEALATLGHARSHFQKTQRM